MADARAPDFDRFRPFELAGWRVHPQLNRISRGGTTHQVEPRIMQVLVILAARAGEIVTREELLDAVWGETIVCEDALTKAVSDLRGLLGDDPRSPKVIETIRKRGYRLIAPVAREKEEDASSALRSGPLRPAAARLLLAAAGAAVLVLFALLLLRPAGGPATAPTLAGFPFTSFRGDEIQPALSPDGAMVAFAWDGGEDGGDLDIYVKQANTETPLRLTDHPAHEYYPVWSPDGSAVAFYRGGERGGIYTVPAIGGPARRMAPVRRIRGFDWSPDGERIAYAARDSARSAFRIRLFSARTAGERWLTDPGGGAGGDRDPRFSPDGRALSFIRADEALRDDLWILPLDGKGKERRITRGQNRISGQDWRADGRRIVFSAAPTTEFGLWSLSVSGGDLQWLPTRGAAPRRPSTASRGEGLVYEEHSLDVNIWRVGLREGGDEGAPLIASTREDCSARFSPDGKRILFLSSRSGDREIWICRRDGTEPRRITSFDGTWVSGAAWSPGGKRIGFTAFPEGYSTVYVVDPEGGEPRRLTGGKKHEEFCGWSADGRWLYYYTHRGESWEVGRVSAEEGRSEPVLSPACRVLHASTDGRFLYYYRPPENGVWRHSLAGEDEDLPVIPPEVTARWVGERGTDRGIYAVVPAGEKASRIVFHPYGSEEEERMILLDAPAAGLDISPDGAEALVDRVERSARDLILVPNFR